MELRHLRYFIAVAEELHFARAAERLHIEQSPLSRAIKELENDLKVQLFERDRQGTRLTWAGEVFLEGARRAMLALDQARKGAEAASKGYRGVLRIAVSDGVAPQRLATLLAKCRQEEPEVRIEPTEMSFADQLKGLKHGLYDAGFALTGNSCNELFACAVWDDPIAIAIPARHPVLEYSELQLADVLRYPLVLPNGDRLAGALRQIQRLLDSVTGVQQPEVAASVASFDLMLTMVSAGYGLGFSTETQLAAYSHSDIVSRPLAGVSAAITTYLLRPRTTASEQLDRFAVRAHSHAICASADQIS
ncbi:LysR family transcriptional regulator [Paraburkholderia aspalathi]|uniref:DNA-binding transcriptional regulator, LysR family n=1 Tax=Paraburkholderia aspalathi TaxID=1324617 RepID=A0A1I7A8E0_9BURK|nr:LysR substrate-binding domain-containing protein [Paraburkholderia aspalathi]SFT71174.1 DNA-binding transcriptional regulator, LysR family [Paraburkholderia aspalathi]